MKSKTKIGICIFFCFLIFSVPFINCVQSIEVKKELEEKRESIMDSYTQKIPLLKSIKMNNLGKKILSLFLFYWLICYILIVLVFSEISSPSSSEEWLVFLFMAIFSSLIMVFLSPIYLRFIISYIVEIIIEIFKTIFEGIINFINDLLDQFLPNRLIRKL